MGDLGFFRGGGGGRILEKIFKNQMIIFFRSIKLFFKAPLKH